MNVNAAVTDLIIIIMSDNWYASANFDVRQIVERRTTKTKTTILRAPPMTLSQIRINER